MSQKATKTAARILNWVIILFAIWAFLQWREGEAEAWREAEAKAAWSASAEGQEYMRAARECMALPDDANLAACWRLDLPDQGYPDE